MIKPVADPTSILLFSVWPPQPEPCKGIPMIFPCFQYGFIFLFRIHLSGHLLPDFISEQIFHAKELPIIFLKCIFIIMFSVIFLIALIPPIHFQQSFVKIRYQKSFRILHIRIFLEYLLKLRASDFDYFHREFHACLIFVTDICNGIIFRVIISGFYIYNADRILIYLLLLCIPHKGFIISVQLIIMNRRIYFILDDDLFLLTDCQKNINALILRFYFDKLVLYAFSFFSFKFFKQLIIRFV